MLEFETGLGKRYGALRWGCWSCYKGKRLLLLGIITKINATSSYRFRAEPYRYLSSNELDLISGFVDDLNKGKN